MDEKIKSCRRGLGMGAAGWGETQGEEITGNKWAEGKRWIKSKSRKRKGSIFNRKPTKRDMLSVIWRERGRTDHEYYGSQGIWIEVILNIKNGGLSSYLQILSMNYRGWKLWMLLQEWLAPTIFHPRNQLPFFFFFLLRKNPKLNMDPKKWPG